MIETLVCIILLGDLSSGIPVKSPIQIATEALLRRPQDFKSAIEGHRMSERIERSTGEGRGPQICEAVKSDILLKSDLPDLPDLPVVARVCKTPPGVHHSLGEGFKCRQEWLSISGISQRVPSGCSLQAVDSLAGLDEWRPLAGFEARVQDLELSSGLQMVAEHRFCKSMGENNGRHRLDGREYFCHQQHLAVNPTDPVSTLLPSGCVCYLPPTYYPGSSAPAAATTTTLLFLLSSFSYYCH